ncbi:MAG: 4-hydroxy-tetrahydrodipicolinate reductase [Bacteroidota bacterium]|nr:4-hydroxy-tetrahydrodipicolinate reductase [Bacteroidota bacterium]
MKIAIIGYGRMGKEIEKLALQRGHDVVLKIDQDSWEHVNPKEFQQIDVAIEFTHPESAFQNILKCFKSNIPVVSGTTGWIDDLDKVIEKCTTDGKSFFYASNFSIGVNLFFKVNEFLASLMNNYTDYSVNIEETHHTKKLDAPSGTAISLAKGIINNINRVNKWEKDKSGEKDVIPVKSIRTGNVPGNHKVTYESEFDKISIEHDAKSRLGFALGAVLAAEFIRGKKGFYTMDDMIN